MLDINHPPEQKNHPPEPPGWVNGAERAPQGNPGVKIIPKRNLRIMLLFFSHTL